MSNPFSDDTIVPTEDEVTVSLEDLVGEGRKYKDANELAKAYAHADALIAKTKAEKAADDAEKKVLRDMLEAQQKQTPVEQKPVERQEPVVQQPAPKEEVDISQLVRKEIESADKDRQEANNVNTVAEQLNRHYGSVAKAQEAVRSKAAELGVTVDFLQDVARRSPAAFFSTVGVTPTRAVSTPGFGNEVVLDRSKTGVKDFKFYEDLRKNNPKAFYSAEVRQQMFDSARELGDKFYTT